ncbi:DNA primase [Candidatus Photodesmus blepharus]|uniref:DNA primase n=1 Tax=Candidatus Photodesmus blepharonis TaxID=1179155 RepID=A0A084CMS7_9GAMM|nr:DNA primase [Candidatus Photodesmus blepharus]KEY91106.1 DNA primase [Candidatus Photodesmus blepharus]
MVGRIPRSFILDLLARFDIVDIVSTRIKLKKKGENYTTCCPFHTERTPSFSVSSAKQFYHCFGCGVHGNLIDFLMKYDGIGFVEAIEELALLSGLDVPHERWRSGQFTRNVEQKRNLYHLMNKIAQFYSDQLKFTKSVVAVSFLRKRGLSSEIIQKFGVGYVPDAWNLIGQKFIQEHEMLIDLGMLVKKNKNKHYDRFRDRIMFPIHDRRGRVIGFGGRALKESVPKYLNSPETFIFHKGRELYGLYEVLKNYCCCVIPKILVVEGYMDVLALAQYGIDYSVASLGTSTTGNHLRTLFQQTNTVICCYDGDKAGKGAAWRTLENSLKYLKTGGMLKFLFLPDGEDPDSYIRQYGKDRFEALIKNATQFSTYLFENLIKLYQLNLGTNEGKSALRAYASKLINKIPDIYFQEVLDKLLDAKTGFDSQLRQTKSCFYQNQFQLGKNFKRTPMREVLALLIQNPNYASLVPDLSSVRELSLPGLGLLFEILDYCRVHPNIKAGQLLEHWRYKENGVLLFRLANCEIPLLNEENQKDVFLDSLDKILARCVEKKIEVLQAKDRSAGLPDQERKELLALMLDFKA